MRLSAMLLGAGLLLAGCGDGSDPGFFVGTWQADSAAIRLTLRVTNQVESMGATRLEGTLSSNKLACLNNGPLAGTVVDKTVQLSAHGSGTGSRFTLVDITGELMGSTIMGSLTMSGDNQNEEMCIFDRAPIVLHK
jgi:hypothetical protein